jgi:tetratricopeptide (TPR) repeat protein
VEALFNLGLVCSQLGEVENAKKYYQHCIAHGYRKADAYQNLGSLKLDQCKYEEARPLFLSALEVDERCAPAWTNLGVIEAAAGNDEKAIAFYEKSIEANFDDAVVHNNMGLVWQKLERHDKAEECFLNALTINDKEPSALINLGNVYRSRGDNNAALSYYRQSLDIEESLVGLSNAAGICKEINDYALAKELTLKMMRYDNLSKPELATIHDTFIQVCEWDHAEAVIEDFKTAAEDPGRVRYSCRQFHGVLRDQRTQSR